MWYDESMRARANGINRITQQLCKQVSEAFKKGGIEHSINQIGSMFTVFFNQGPVADYASAIKSDTGKYAKYFTEMLKAGIYLPPSQFETCFISTEHGQKDLDKTTAAIRKVPFNFQSSIIPPVSAH